MPATTSAGTKWLVSCAGWASREPPAGGGCAPPDPTLVLHGRRIWWSGTSAPRHHRPWVVDLTYVATWAGVAYVCFITDAYSRMIVGWRVAGHMRTQMVLDALEMARWRRGTRLEGLVAHSDAGSQFTSVRYGERLAELGAVPSIGSVGDSFDNALAETVNGLYKSELIRGPDQGPWRSVDDVELATLSWVYWYNTQRLHGYLGDIPPVEYEEAHYAQPATPATIGNQQNEPPSTPGRFTSSPGIEDGLRTDPPRQSTISSRGSSGSPSDSGDTGLSGSGPSSTPADPTGTY